MTSEGGGGVGWGGDRRCLKEEEDFYAGRRVWEALDR